MDDPFIIAPPEPRNIMFGLMLKHGQQYRLGTTKAEAGKFYLLWSVCLDTGRRGSRGWKLWFSLEHAHVLPFWTLFSTGRESVRTWNICMPRVVSPRVRVASISFLSYKKGSIHELSCPIELLPHTSHFNVCSCLHWKGGGPHF